MYSVPSHMGKVTKSIQWQNVLLICIFTFAIYDNNKMAPPEVDDQEAQYMYVKFC